jgi:phosphoribulokinase
MSTPAGDRAATLLAVVGDSASGKTTLTRGLARVLGETQVVQVPSDDYHRYDRAQRRALGITPLDPSANYLDILARDLESLAEGRPILRPTYRHTDGTHGPPEYTEPGRYIVVDGLLCLQTDELRQRFDCAVYMDPPEAVRREWKIIRDTTRRGYTTDEVLDELDRRERDAARWVRPQRAFADIVITFRPGADPAEKNLDAEVLLRPTLPIPDLSGLGRDDPDDLSITELEHNELLLAVPGILPPGRAQEIEEAIWERMHFARHLQLDRLGQFTRGVELFRSDALAITQLLVLYQLVHARAASALGVERPPRVPPASATDPAGTAGSDPS